MKILTFIYLLILAFLLTGCAGFRISGGIQTDYGSITSDGKTVTILADARTSGFAK